MVKKCILIVLFLSSVVSAGEFTASVRNKNVSLGKSFALTLTLEDLNATGTPDISELQKEFVVHSKQQSSSTVILNGKLSSNTSWKYILIPPKEGILNIPSISIDTEQGTLWSQPIDIHVTKPESSSVNSVAKGEKDLIVTTHTSKTTPYKNEPIIYIVKLMSTQPFRNIQVERLEIENTIIEMIKEPDVYSKVIDGVRTNILEFPMLITPLKSGTLVIPRIMVQGEIPSANTPRSRSLFEQGFPSFHMFEGTGLAEPFAIRTEETILNIQEPVPGIIPWLPAVSLSIEEQWDETQTIQVGEPLTRSFKISAIGLRETQLPHLEKYLKSNQNFKVYSDKPKTGENITTDNIFSFRAEQFTIIPQREGKITFPEINIPWWDVNSDNKEIAKVPSRIIEVAPAVTIPQEPKTADKVEVPAPVVIQETNPLLYVLIAILLLFLILTGIWVFSLQKKLGRLSEGKESLQKDSSDKKEAIKHKELQNIKTAKELHEYLQNYSHDKWGTPLNATVGQVCDNIKEHLHIDQYERLDILKKRLENALYHQDEFHIHENLKNCSSILDKIQNTKTTTSKKEKLPELNPN